MLSLYLCTRRSMARHLVSGFPVSSSLTEPAPAFSNLSASISVTGVAVAASGFPRCASPAGGLRLGALPGAAVWAALNCTGAYLGFGVDIHRLILLSPASGWFRLLKPVFSGLFACSSLHHVNHWTFVLENHTSTTCIVYMQMLLFSLWSVASFNLTFAVKNIE